MATFDDTYAFLRDELFIASSTSIQSTNNHQNNAADHDDDLFQPPREERPTRYGKQGKIARSKRMQPPVHVAGAVSSAGRYQGVFGNLALRPAAVPPEQLDGIPRQAIAARGELALMRAVLSDAIECYQKRFVTTHKKTQQPGNEAVAWFAADDEDWPFSFLNICRALALDPNYIRRGLKLWRQHIATVQAVVARRERAAPTLPLRAVS